jgi:tetratricopeptide (TPR) repeat protein
MKCLRVSAILPFILFSFIVPVSRAMPADNPPGGDFDDLAQRARMLVDSDPAGAATLFRQALALRPSWPEGWMYLAGDLYALNRYSEARDAFQRGLALAPKNGIAWGFLGLSEYELGDHSRALNDFGKGEILGLGASRDFEADVRAHAAFILAHQSRFDEAIAQLQPLSRQGESTPPLITATGICALTMTKLPSEFTSEERLLVDLAGKAMWEGNARHPDEAQREFHELLERYPDAHGVHYAYGVYLMEIDQHAALDEFRRELAIQPSHWPTLLIAAFLETRAGAPEISLEMAEKAAKLAPQVNRWVAQTAIGHAYLTMGEAARALPFLETAEKQAPENTSVHFYLEKAYRQAGRMAEAQKQKAEFLRLKELQDPLMLPGGPSMGAN